MVVIYSGLYYYTKEKPTPPPRFSYLMKNSECGQTNWLVELFNCGNHGYLNAIELYDESMLKAWFAETDIDPEIVEAIHAPTKMAAALANYHQVGMLSELRLLSDQGPPGYVEQLGVPHGPPIGQYHIPSGSWWLTGESPTYWKGCCSGQIGSTVIH